MPPLGPQRCSLRLAFALSLALIPGLVHAAPPEAAEHFEKKIRPVLIEHCYKCHADQGKVRGGLRLDSREALRKGGDTGPALVPGKPEQSLLLKALRYGDDAPHMPPKSKLPDAVIADFELWIKQGAFDPRETKPAVAAPTPTVARDHWAFQPVKRNLAPPAVKNTAWPNNAVDRFILTEIEKHNLTPTAAADRRTLLRRITFDLTGLPPTPEEMDAFLADRAADAFEKVVDRLLASPHYGERWGRHWLDVVRYADTAGETADFPAPHAWRYRNYVIDAFNRDKPFDQFIREQIAGDILARKAPPEQYAELVTATGYLAVARRFGFKASADHYLTIEDTIDTLGKSILGLTLGCARCHDHKYDPVSSVDYYGLYGIFDSTRYAFPGSEHEPRPRHMVPLQPAMAAMIEDWPGFLGMDKPFLPSLDVAYAVVEGKPHNARVHKRGEPTMLGDEVPRRFLQCLGGQMVPPDGGSGRRALADWLADPANPLTARVMVNRVWQYHLGTGLVATPNDFGSRGSRPSHPELLDYLTARFIAEGWSIKKLHRRIVLSATYRQSAEGSADSLRLDANNVWLSRFPRRRLSAEEIRDSILAVSGDLDRAPGGPHPFPPEKGWTFSQHNPFAAVYDHNRRSVYLMTPRLKRHPFLGLFDGADPNATTGRRDETTVPTQALFFMNDPFIHAKSTKLAERLLALPDETARLDRAYRLCFGRPPTDGERTVAQRFLSASKDPKQAWASWARVMLASNEFLYVD
jgi:hypothetical protein